MKTTPARIAQPLDLLNRILQEPELVSQVQHLDARTLGGIIRYVGLEDVGEIISLATTEQLKEIFDEDLWRSERPGEAETFDAERFGLWLEVMLDADPKGAANKVAGMEEDFVAMALSRHILALDLDELQYRFSEDDSEDGGLVDKALEGSLNYEFGAYLIVAKDECAWDATLALLAELDSDHSSFLHRVLERCRRLSSASIESEGGLYNLLSAGEQLELDVADERERRREQKGYVTPQSAAHFLHRARTMDPEAISADGADPITKRYFAAYESTYQTAAAAAPERRSANGADLLARLLQSAPMHPEARRALPGAVSDEPIWPIRRALARLAEDDAALHSRRLIELNYLANVLIAGCPHHGWQFRPAEAVQAAVATCNLALESFGPDVEEEAGALVQLDMVALFRRGWRRLYREVALPVASSLHAALKRLPLRKPRLISEDREHIADLCADLEKALAAGTPWTGADQLIILETLFDSSEVYALTTLIAECPTIPDTLEFSSRARPRCKSEFIHSDAQLRLIRSFAESLPERLR